jgi:hypothetical protein
MKNFKLFALMGAFICVAFSGCSQDTKDPVVVVDTTIYEDCCGTEPVEFKNGGVYVFVPNVFTPNNDGINDYFYPIVDKNVREVVNYVILNATGDTVIFTRQSVNFNTLINSAWDGMRIGNRKKSTLPLYP